MSGNPFYSGRIPPELLKHIENHRQKSGESKTEILIRALSAYTGFALPKSEIELDNPLLNRIESLEKTIKQNQKIIASHEKIINELQNKINYNKPISQETSKSSILPLFPEDNKSDNKQDNTASSDQEKGLREGIYSHKEVEDILSPEISKSILRNKHYSRTIIEKKNMVWMPIDKKGTRQWEVKRITH